MRRTQPGAIGYRNFFGFMLRKSITFQNANVILEVVIILPLFLLGLFLVIWIAYISNARASLGSAVENAARLAGTRGKPGLYQGEAISSYDFLRSGAIKALDEYHLSRSIPSDQKRRELLTYKVEGHHFAEFYDGYVKTVFEPIGIEKLSDLPAHYSYALAYAARAMRMSVGESIRYPCDPYDTNDSKQGEYCLLCRPVNPVTKDDTPFDPADYPNEDETIIFRRLALRCDYKPGGFVVKPIMAMFNLLRREGDGEGGDFVFSQYTYFDSYEACFHHTYRSSTGSEIGRYCCQDRNDDLYCF